MRTMQRTTVMFAGAVLFGFFLGVGEYQVIADPVACGQWQCCDYYSWTSGNLQGINAVSAEIAGTIPGAPGANTHTTNALTNIYTPAAAGILPLVNSGTYDRYYWTTNTAQCKKNKDGTWPLPQTVLPGGTATPDINVVRNECSHP